MADGELAVEEIEEATSVREGRRERRARETRRRIVLAALDLFTERGMDSVTVEEIADRADVARATVFNYFATKESLCHGIAQIQFETLQEALLENRLYAHSVGEKLTHVFRLMSELPGRNPDQCRAVLARSLSTMKPGEVPEHRKQIFLLIQKLVEEGQQSGELRKDAPSCELAGFLMGVHFHTTILWAFGFVEGSLEERQARALRLALEGLRG